MEEIRRQVAETVLTLRREDLSEAERRRLQWRHRQLLEELADRSEAATVLGTRPCLIG